MKHQLKTSLFEKNKNLEIQNKGKPSLIACICLIGIKGNPSLIICIADRPTEQAFSSVKS